MFGRKKTVHIGRIELFSASNWRMRTKILSIIIAVLVLSVVSLAALNYYSTSTSTIQMTGEMLQSQGNSTLNRAEEVIEGSVKPLEALALSPAIIEYVEAANQKYSGRSAIEVDAEISDLDKAWIDKKSSIETLVSKVANNEVSYYLKSFKQAFPEQDEVFITDIKGLNVAMTDRTSDYLQSDESWWKESFNNGKGAVYIGQVEYDDSTKSWAMNVGVPVKDKSGKQVVGVLRGTIDVSVVFDTISKTTFGKTGHAVLLDRNGKILYAHNRDHLMKEAPEEVITLFKAGNSAWWSNMHDLDGNPAVVAINYMEGDLGKTLGWAIFLDQDLSEVNDVARNSLFKSLLVAAIVALLLGIVGVLFARSITRPLAIVTGQARRMAEGDLEEGDAYTTTRLAKRGDEIGDFARAFQELQYYFREIASASQRIAAGDLSVQIQARNEKDLLGNAFARMVENLRRLIRDVAENASQVSQAAGQLSVAADHAGIATNQIATSIQQVASGNQGQSATVQETSAYINQLSRAIDQITRGAKGQADSIEKASSSVSQLNSSIAKVAFASKEVYLATQQAQQAANSGAGSVQKTAQGMGAIKTSTSIVASKVQELGSYSDQIGTIVETIDDIAEQTNLLALNAAIEAARAGEHGRGFAVVADEVRKLAERSSKSTKEIANLIARVQKGTQEAVAAMAKGSREVDSGSVLAEEAGEALKNILVSVQAAADQVSHITLAVQQMEAASKQVVSIMDSVSNVIEESVETTEKMASNSQQVMGAIDRVAAVNEETSAVAEEVSASTEEMSAQVEEMVAQAQNLAQMAEVLQAAVAQFKLEESGVGDVMMKRRKDDWGGMEIPKRIASGIRS